MFARKTRRRLLVSTLLGWIVLIGIAKGQREFEPPAAGDRDDVVPTKVSQARDLFLRGEHDAALQRLSAVLAIDASDAAVHLLIGDIYAAQAKYDRAAASYQQAIQLNPDSLGGLCNYAWLLATCPADSVRDGKRATEMCERLLGLVEGKEALRMLLPVVLDTCAASHAETGQFEAAIQLQQRALAALPDGEAAQRELAEASHKEFSERLALYRERRPYRDQPKAID